MTRSRVHVWFAIILAVLGGFWIARSLDSPDTPQTTFYAHSEYAETILNVYGFTNVLMIAIFFVVEGALVWAMFRYRRRGDELPRQTHGNTTVEYGLAIATTFLALVLFVASCRAIPQLAGAPPGDDPLVVEVDGRQWWWEFYYPEYDVVTTNELHLPVGRPVYLKLTSQDVIHSFWIPRLGGKRDLVAGRTQTMWFTPREPGVYDGLCAEYCGSSHALMAMQAIVHEPGEFAAWVQGQKAPAPASTDPLVQQGQVAFLSTAACITCHMPFQNDKSVRRMQGPNLRKVATRRTIASSQLPNDTEHLRRWISNPQAVKPGALMNVVVGDCTAEAQPRDCCTGPGTGNCFDDQTLAQLVAYLQSLK